MRIILLPTIMLAFACTSRPLAHDDEAGTTTNPGTTDDATDDDSDDATDLTGTGTGTSTDEGLTFVPVDDMPYVEMCDIFLQDCPEGEKCVPYASSGGSWDANKCVPVLGGQAHGEPCTWAGIIEATDDCDATSMCWNTQMVDGEYVGTCLAYCTGSADTPQCPPGSSCLVGQEGWLAVCELTCDPIAQDCNEGLGCYWASSQFNCVFTTDDIPTGEPCGYLNDCAPGHLCADATALPSCAGSACCTQYCNLPDGDAGCVAQPGTVCTAFFEMGMVPDGYEHVGVCIIPGA
jgi:hypothetical protein